MAKEISDKYLTVISCFDGRIIPPLVRWFEVYFPGYNPDLITEPGADALLSNKSNWIYKDRPNEIVLTKNALLHTIEKIRLSISLHASDGLIVAGHVGQNGKIKGCAANPGERNVHEHDVINAIQLLKKEGINIPMLGAVIILNKERAFGEAFYQDDAMPRPHRKTATAD